LIGENNMSFFSSLKTFFADRARKRIEREMIELSFTTAPAIGEFLKKEFRKIAIQAYKNAQLSPPLWDDWVIKIILIIAGYDPAKIKAEAEAELNLKPPE